MKSVFSAFAICLAFSLLNTSSGSPALFKRMPLELEAQQSPNVTDGGVEYIMPHYFNLDKSDVKVYNDAKNVAFSIPRQTQSGHFVIENSQGAKILEVERDDSIDCSSGSSYMTVDAKATFKRGMNSGPWSVSFDGKIFTLESPPDLPKSTYERGLKNSNGVVDTTIATTLSASEGFLPMSFIDTIRRSPSSACPPEYIVALLVVEVQELNKLNRC